LTVNNTFILPTCSITFGHLGGSNKEAHQRRLQIIGLFEQYNLKENQTDPSTLQAIASQVQLAPETIRKYLREWRTGKFSISEPTRLYEGSYLQQRVTELHRTANRTKMAEILRVSPATIGRAKKALGLTQKPDIPTIAKKVLPHLKKGKTDKEIMKKLNITKYYLAQALQVLKNDQGEQFPKRQHGIRSSVKKQSVSKGSDGNKLNRKG
jgi:hypothetical protein